MTYTDLTVGTTFMLDGQPFIVVSGEFHRMQMRKAIMRTQIRNLLTGALVQRTFTASDKFDPAQIDEIFVNYLYHETDTFHFMEKETFEQYQVSKEVLGSRADFLTEDMNVKLILFNGNPVSMDIPKNVNLTVLKSPPAIRGNTVTNTFKAVICQNDIQVQAPLFIKEGDVIKVSTETNEYIERVNTKK